MALLLAPAEEHTQAACLASSALAAWPHLTRPAVGEVSFHFCSPAPHSSAGSTRARASSARACGANPSGTTG
eukprot:12236033-Alexandrium_andersonii.AAC.1